MFAMTSIITLRLILFIAALITSAMHNYYIPFSCAQIAWFYTNYALGSLLDTYPQCSPSPNATISNDTTSTSTSDVYVAVNANFNGTPDQIGASLDVNFGMAIWLALFLHLVGVEIYLRLTPREAERLREVSWKRQSERGFEWPGSAGLTVDRWGDAERWVPRGERVVGEGDGEVRKEGEAGKEGEV